MSDVAAADGKRVFYRDAQGELHALKPGEENPDDKREREKTDEDHQYEAYLEGRQAGKVRRIGGYSDGIDRAALEASSSYAEIQDRESKGEAKQYKPAAAYNHKAKVKKQGGGGNGDTRDMVADAMRNGAGRLQQAMERAREASDDDELPKYRMRRFRALPLLRRRSLDRSDGARKKVPKTPPKRLAG